MNLKCNIGQKLCTCLPMCILSLWVTLSHDIPGGLTFFGAYFLIQGNGLEHWVVGIVLLSLRMFSLDLSAYTLPSILLSWDPWALLIVEMLAKTMFSSQKSFPRTLPCRTLLDVSKAMSEYIDASLHKG